MFQVDQGGGPGKRPTTAGKKIKTQANELVIIELIIFIVIIKNPPQPKAKQQKKTGEKAKLVQM